MAKSGANHTPTPWIVKRGLSLSSSSVPYWTGESSDGKHTSFTALHEVDAAFIVRAVNSFDELLTAVKIALEYLDAQNHARNVVEQIAFKKHQRYVLTDAIAKAERSDTFTGGK